MNRIQWIHLLVKIPYGNAEKMKFINYTTILILTKVKLETNLFLSIVILRNCTDFLPREADNFDLHLKLNIAFSLKMPPPQPEFR